jgi:hypothetical protein
MGRDVEHHQAQRDVHLRRREPAPPASIMVS